MYAPMPAMSVTVYNVYSFISDRLDVRWRRVTFWTQYFYAHLNSELLFKITCRYTNVEYFYEHVSYFHPFLWQNQFTS